MLLIYQHVEFIKYFVIVFEIVYKYDDVKFKYQYHYITKIGIPLEMGPIPRGHTD